MQKMEEQGFVVKFVYSASFSLTYFFQIQYKKFTCLPLVAHCHQYAQFAFHTGLISTLSCPVFYQPFVPLIRRQLLIHIFLLI